MCCPAIVSRIYAARLRRRSIVRPAHASSARSRFGSLLVFGVVVLGVAASLAAQSSAEFATTTAELRNDLTKLNIEVRNLQLTEQSINPTSNNFVDSAQIVREADAVVAECREFRKVGEESATKWQPGAQLVQAAEQAAGETRQDGAVIRPSLDRVDQLAASSLQREQAAEIVRRYDAAGSTVTHGGERLAEARRLNNEAKVAFLAEKTAVQSYTTAQRQIDLRLEQLKGSTTTLKRRLEFVAEYEQDRMRAQQAADSLVTRLRQFQTSVNGKGAALEQTASDLLAEARAVRNSNLPAYVDALRKLEADRDALAKRVKSAEEEAAALRNRRDLQTQFADQAVDAAGQAQASAETRLAASRSAYEKALEFLRRKTPDSTTVVPAGKVRVPLVTDLKVNEATALVRKAGLVPTLVLAGEFPVSADTTVVNGQDPSAGTEVDVGSTVNISFSATTAVPPGPRPPDVVDVPDLVGLPAQQAYAKLAGLALMPSSTFDRGPAPAGKAGTVKAQNPPARTKLARTFAVDLKIYGAVVPSVIGRSVSSANAILNDVGLSIDRVAFDRRPPSEQDAEKIYLQNPAGGEPLAPEKKLVSVHVFSTWAGGAPPPPATVTGGPSPPGASGIGFQTGDGVFIHPTLVDAKISDGAYTTPPGERTSVIASVDLPRVGPGAQLIAGFHGYMPGQDPPWDSRNVSLRRCTNEVEAERLFREGVRIEKEFKAKPMAAGSQSQPNLAPGVIGAGFRLNKLVDNPKYLYVETSNWGPYQSKAKGDWSRNEWRGGHVLEVYRDVFLISTASHKCRDPEVKEKIEEDVRTMVENAKKLIDRRFPLQKQP